MFTSEQTDKIYAAMAKAQSAFGPIPKNQTGKVQGVSKQGRSYEYTYKYADLSDVLKIVLPVLSEYELALVQATAVVDGVIFLRTRITHASGQWVEGEYPVCSITGDHQRMGGALTYARRYSACALLGVAATEDLDGVEADKVDEPPPPPRRRPQEVAKAPPVPHFDEDDSGIRAAAMIDRLTIIKNDGTRNDLHEFATKTQEDRARLLDAHRHAVKTAFDVAQKAVSERAQMKAAE
jgi:hypothetical protein